MYGSFLVCIHICICVYVYVFLYALHRMPFKMITCVVSTFQIKPYRQLSFVSFDFMILQRNLVHQTKHRTHPIILMRPQWNQSVWMVKRETKPNVYIHNAFVVFIQFVLGSCLCGRASFFFFFFSNKQEKKKLHTYHICRSTQNERNDYILADDQEQ